MAYVTWKVERYASTGANTWSSTPETLTDVYDIDVQMSLGEGKDSFAMKLVNFNGVYNNYFKPQDKLVISRVTNSTSVGVNDAIMTGAIKNLPNESSGRSSIIRLEGYNFSESIMSAITFVDINTLTPPAAIQQAILNAKSIGALGLTWDTTNPTLKKDTVSAFPTFSKSYKNVTLLKVLEECSSNQFTQDGAYYWWVTYDNKLKWKPNTTGAVYSFNAASDDHLSIKDGVDTNEVRNYFILKGGRDPAGKSIQVKYIDYASANKHGNKYYINTAQTATAETLYSQDFPVGSTSVIPSAFPFTTKWLSQETNATVTVNSASEYVEAIRDEIKYRLDKEARALAEVLGKGKLKVDVVFPAGLKTWQLADQINCTLPRIFSGTKVMRVKEIQYGTDRDVFSLEEDVGSI